METSKLKNDDVTIVTPPSLFLPRGGASITMMGSGDAWQNGVINQLVDVWSDEPLTIYCHTTNWINSDLNWFAIHAESTDYTLIHLDSELDATVGLLTLTGRLSSLPNVWISFGKDYTDEVCGLLTKWSHNPVRRTVTDQTSAIIDHRFSVLNTR